jgi:hypothetical protein
MTLRANSPVNRNRSWIELFQRTEGLPQGNALSPVLSNIYLNRFDQECECLRYSRYADDILVLGRTKSEVVRALRRIKNLLEPLGLRLNEKKTLIVDLHRRPLTFLGYELSGGNLRPPKKAVLRLQHKLRVRGLEAREKINLMQGFVSRYRLGSVRKLFRRIDRELRPYYPAGVSLTGILDDPAGFTKRAVISSEVFAGPKGKAACVTAKKARFGQAPVAVAAGEQDSMLNACSLAPMELSQR